MDWLGYYPESAAGKVHTVTPPLCILLADYDAYIRSGYRHHKTMRLKLQYKIQLALFLLFCLPTLLFIVATNGVNEHKSRPLANAVLQQLLNYHRQTMQADIQAVIDRPDIKTPLPPLLKGYWHKVQDAWQGTRRVPQQGLYPCPVPSGGYITQVSAHLVQLYFCRQTEYSRELFLLNPAQLLQHDTATPDIKLALAFPAENILFSALNKNEDITTIPETLRMELKSKPAGHLEHEQLHYFWNTTDIGNSRLLLSYQRPAAWLRWMVPGAWTLFCILFSVVLSHWLTRLILQRLAFFSRAAALVSLGDFSFRLPEEQQDEFHVINLLFNRMLGEIQRQKAHVSTQNRMLQETNARLRETLDTVQLMQGERFERARMLLQSAELGLLRHAVRTPLTTLQEALTQLVQLQQALATQIQHPGLNRSELQESSQHLHTLATLMQDHIQLLQQHILPGNATSGLEMGEASEFRLLDLLHKLATDFASRIDDAQHKLYLRCPTQLFIYGYYQALYQVLSHLLTNALQHAFPDHRAGEILISAKTENEKIIITCRDTGVGINQIQQQRLFQPFASTDHEYQAAGLGLYLARQLVEELLTGRLYYQPSHEQGSTFIIELPCSASRHEE